jgi:hypothetical protein
MRKLYILFTLLLALTFLTACAVPIETPAPQNTATNTDTNTNVPEIPPAPAAEQPTVPPNNPNDKSTFSAPIVSVGTAIVDRNENSITQTFENQKGVPIFLTLTGEVAKYSKSECKNPQLTAAYKGEVVEALVTKIADGDQFTITWDCERLPVIPEPGTRFSADLKFYYKLESGTIFSEMGTVLASYS